MRESDDGAPEDLQMIEVECCGHINDLNRHGGVLYGSDPGRSRSLWLENGKIRILWPRDGSS